jgi:hypothetical protein
VSTLTITIKITINAAEAVNAVVEPTPTPAIAPDVQVDVPASVVDAWQRDQAAWKKEADGYASLCKQTGSRGDRDSALKRARVALKRAKDRKEKAKARPKAKRR